MKVLARETGRFHWRCGRSRRDAASMPGSPGRGPETPPGPVRAARQPDPRHGGESGTPAVAVDLPCPVGSLDDVECDRARLDGRVAALAAGCLPAPGRDAGHAAVPGEPGSGCDRGRLASPVC